MYLVFHWTLIWHASSTSEATTIALYKFNYYCHCWDNEWSLCVGSFIWCLWNAVQKISPDSKDKVQLQVVLQQGGANSFHFANPAGRTKQVEERDSVKELLQQLLPRFRRKVNADLEEKNRFVYVQWWFSCSRCRGYRGGSPTAVQPWQTCPLWELSPSHPILV